MRSRTCSSVICGSHWKGVCDLGTNGEMAAVTCRRGIPRPAASRALRHRSTMASISSCVSPGRPIMKYSFTCCQPCSNSLRTCSISPSSVTPLLMMSRRRWLPASGARVAPVRRMPARRRMMSSSMEPTRRDGRDTEICSASQRSIVPRNKVFSAEKSPVLRARKDTSSKPVSFRQFSRIFSRFGRLRSRAGRYRTPA